MLQIRKNVFETNSSSSHSLTLAEDVILPAPFTPQELREGVVTVSLGEYGWEWYRYYTTPNKLSYLLTQALAVAWSGEAYIPEGDAACVTKTVCDLNAKVALLCDVVKTYTGCDVLFVPGSKGYVDSDSLGNGLELFKSVDDLQKFLFSAEAYIQTGNDNSPPNPLIDTDKDAPDHYYVANYLEPKGDWKSISFTIDVKWYHLSVKSLITSTGIELSDNENSELYHAVLAQGTVVFAKWVTQGRRAHFSYFSPLDGGLSELSSCGLKFSKNITIVEDFSENNTYENMKVKIKFKLPAEVAATIQQAGCSKQRSTSPR